MVVAAITGVVNVVVPDPPASTPPPLELAYQSIVSPINGVAEILRVPVPHRVPLVPNGDTGKALTVKLTLEEVAGEEQVPVMLHNNLVLHQVWKQN